MYCLSNEKWYSSGLTAEPACCFGLPLTKYKSYEIDGG